MLRPALLASVVLMSLPAAAQGVDPRRTPEAGLRPSAEAEVEPRRAVEDVRIPWDRDRAYPEGFRLESGPRLGLVVGGAATFGFAYLTGVIIVATDAELLDSDVEQQEASGDNEALLSPIIGPWVALGTTSPSAGEAALLVTGGVLQAGGLAMFLAGLATRSYWLERDRPVVVDVGPGTVTLRARF